MAQRLRGGAARAASAGGAGRRLGDRPQAVRELARVVRPAGRLLLRANFSDHHPRPRWLEHFPRGLEADASLFQPLHEVIGFRHLEQAVAADPDAPAPVFAEPLLMLERHR